MSTIKVVDGDKQYRNDNGQLHREDGPAMIWATGSKFWFVNGVQNSTTYPSDRWANGNMYWGKPNSRYWREDGPAHDCPNGRKIWNVANNTKGKMVWPKL